MFWYRCTECRTIVSNKDIKTGKGCRKCKGMRISPTELSFLEMVQEIWRWPGMLFRYSSWKPEKVTGMGKNVLETRPEQRG